jgi:trehalose 6-phosphate phosphatase
MRPATLQAAWRATASVATATVLFFDFDGTLAPISEDPVGVHPTPGLVELLHKLSAQVGRIAVVSARPADFLYERLGALSDVDLYGLYGLEVRRAGAAATAADPEALAWSPLIAALAELARAELPAGAMVEDKRLSVSLHYRTAPELAGTVEAWAAERAAEHGLRAQPGRMVVELKPPVDRDKGWVVRDELGPAVKAAWYFGDDLADLAGFEAIAEREEKDPGFLGIRVAVRNPETGDEVAETADYTVDSTAAVPAILAAGLAELARQAP